MNIPKIWGLAAIVAIGQSAMPAWSADNCSGRINNVAISSEVIEVAKDHTMVIFSAHSISTSDNSLYNGAGKCGGYAITTPDGKTRMVGVCARKTKDGDTWSDEWVLEAGAEKGTWKQSGSTGALANKKSSGWWQPISDDGKLFMGRWGGSCN